MEPIFRLVLSKVIPLKQVDLCVETIKFDLIKEFELLGYWWLPEHESEKVFGILSFKNFSIELNLKGLLSSDEDEFNDTQIHGRSEDGHYILLTGCYTITRPVFNLALTPKERIRASLILIDVEQDANDIPIEFESIRIGLPQVLDSARFNGFDLEVTESGDFCLPFRKDTDCLSFPIEALEATLRICSYDAFKIESRSSTFKQIGYVELTTKSPQNIRWFTKQLGEIESLFSLMTSQPCLAQWLKLSIHDNEDKCTYYCILPNKQLGNYLPAARHEHLICICQMGSSFEEVLKSFFEKSPALYPVINILNSTLAQPGAFHQLDFVNLVQALEGLHRVFDNNYYLEKQELKAGKEQIRRAIEGAFPGEVNSELRESLWSSIQFANAKSQKTRLNELIAKLSPILRVAIIGHNENFVHEIISTRNYYVHLDHKSARKALSDGMIPFRKMQLQMLLICILLKAFGVDDLLMMENLKRTKLFRHFKHKRDK